MAETNIGRHQEQKSLEEYHRSNDDYDIWLKSKLIQRSNSSSTDNERLVSIEVRC